MPSIYAHDKFGKMVFEQLPKEEKAIIKKYPKAYKIGLQGPDFLFFYRAIYKNKVNQRGVFYHHQDAYLFIQHALKVIDKYGKNSSQYSYILGFICHFTLDDACHPYVAEAMKVTGCGHAEVEGDFDQLLLAHDGYEPHKVHLAALVPTDIETAKSIQPFYNEFSVKTIRRSLQWMKRVKRFLYAPGVVKRILLDLLMRASFHYKKFKGHVISPKVNRKCRKQSKQLYRLLKKSVSKGVNLIENFSDAYEVENISTEFHKDFYGRKVS